MTTYKFPKFAEECEAAGLIGIRRTDTHWQIARRTETGTGKLVCDIWPTVDKWRPHVPGIKPGTRGGSPGHALAWLTGVIPPAERLKGVTGYRESDTPVLRPAKVFRGAVCDGSRPDGLRLRRACDYLNKEGYRGFLPLTPEVLAAALSVPPTVEEYRDTIRGLLDLISLEDLLRPDLAAAVSRAEELLSPGINERGEVILETIRAVGDAVREAVKEVKAEELPEEETPEQERERLLKERKAAAKGETFEEAFMSGDPARTRAALKREREKEAGDNPDDVEEIHGD